MEARSLAVNAVRVVAIAVALVALVLTPIVSEGPSGRSYEPLGIVVDLVALVVLVAVAWPLLRARLRSGPVR